MQFIYQNVRLFFGSQDQPTHPFWHTNGPQLQQVHGTTCKAVFNPRQNCFEADALRTDQASLPIGVFTADCLPILASNGTTLLAIHAGYRGLRDHIIKQADSFLKPHDWRVWLGPSIGPCCYEVSSELIDTFADMHPTLERTTLSPSFRKLDLKAIAMHQLMTLGIKEIHTLDFCTYCSTSPVFYSVRRNPTTGRQVSAIWRDPS